MHIKRHVFLIILSALLTLPLFVLAVMSLIGLPDIGLPAYYGEDANYETISGVLVQDAWVYDTDVEVFIYLDGSSADNNNFSTGDYTFSVPDPPAGFAERMKEGTRVTITAAPGFFGDGWTYPAAAVSTDEGVVISFEDGKAAVVSHAKDSEVTAVIFLLIFPALFVGNILMCVFSIRELVSDIVLKRQLRQRRREEPHASLPRTASSGEPGGRDDFTIK